MYSRKLDLNLTTIVRNLVSYTPEGNRYFKWVEKMLKSLGKGEKNDPYRKAKSRKPLCKTIGFLQRIKQLKRLFSVTPFSFSLSFDLPVSMLFSARREALS